MSITTNEEARSTVDGWLKENGHQTNAVKDDNASFHFEIDYPLGSLKRQRIIQPSGFPGLCVLLNGVAIADDHKNRLKEMSEEERDAFYAEIRNDLLFLDNSYDLMIDDDGVAKQVQFSYEFYFDGLTKTNLFKGLLLNHRTLLYIVNKFNEKFGVPVMPKNETLGGVVEAEKGPSTIQ